MSTFLVPGPGRPQDPGLTFQMGDFNCFPKNIFEFYISSQ